MYCLHFTICKYPLQSLEVKLKTQKLPLVFICDLTNQPTAQISASSGPTYLTGGVWVVRDGRPKFRNAAKKKEKKVDRRKIACDGRPKFRKARDTLEAKRSRVSLGKVITS